MCEYVYAIQVSVAVSSANMRNLQSSSQDDKLTSYQ